MSNDPRNPPGPSRETLKALLGTVKSYMKAKDEGIRIAKGKVQQVLRPRKFCKICGLTFDRVFMDPNADIELQPEICKKCDGELKEGWIALVSHKEAQPIWIRGTGDLEKYRGSILHVSHEVYVAYLNRMKELKRSKDNGQQQQQRPTEPD